MSDVTEVTEDVARQAVLVFLHARWPNVANFESPQIEVDAMRAALEAVMPIGQQASADINQLTIERDNLQARLEVMRERKDKAEAERDAAVFANRDAMDHFKQMEAELTALRKRIEDAPVHTVGGSWQVASGVLTVSHDMIGKRVRLLWQDN